MAVDSFTLLRMNLGMRHNAQWVELKPDEKVEAGDLCINSGGDSTGMLVHGYERDEKTAAQAKKDGYDQVLRPVGHDPVDENRMMQLEDELEWAWQHLLAIGDNMQEIYAHRKVSGELLDTDLSIKEDDDDDDDESDTDDPAND